MDPLALVLSPITMGVRIYKRLWWVNKVIFDKHCMDSIFGIGYELNLVLDYFVGLEVSSSNKVDNSSSMGMKPDTSIHYKKYLFISGCLSLMIKNLMPTTKFVM